MNLFKDMVISHPDRQFPRCIEHAVHLGAGHFIKIVSLTSARILVKKIRKAFHNAQLEDNQIDFDALEADLGGDNNNDNEHNEDDTNNADDDEDDEMTVGFTVGDTIGKSLALVKQVSTFQFVRKIMW